MSGFCLHSTLPATFGNPTEQRFAPAQKQTQSACSCVCEREVGVKTKRGGRCGVDLKSQTFLKQIINRCKICFFDALTRGCYALCIVLTAATTSIRFAPSETLCTKVVMSMTKQTLKQPSNLGVLKRRCGCIVLGFNKATTTSVFWRFQGTVNNKIIIRRNIKLWVRARDLFIVFPDTNCQKVKTVQERKRTSCGLNEIDHLTV